MIEAHRRRRDPGDGPPRPHARSRCTPWAASRCRAASRTPRCALVADAKALAARRLLRHRARGRARRGGPHGHRRRRRADHRHRRRPALRRPGARVPRRARHRGPHRAQVRAPLRRRSRPTASAPSRPSPPTCARAPSRPTRRATTSAGEVAETLGLYGEHGVVAGADTDRSARGRRPCAGGDRSCWLRPSPSALLVGRRRSDRPRPSRPTATRPRRVGSAADADAPRPTASAPSRSPSAPPTARTVDALPARGRHRGAARAGAHGRHRPSLGGLRRHALRVRRRTSTERVLDEEHARSRCRSPSPTRTAPWSRTADMVPCPAGTESCPITKPDAPYRYAVEVPSGAPGRRSA